MSRTVPILALLVGLVLVVGWAGWTSGAGYPDETEHARHAQMDVSSGRLEADLGLWWVGTVTGTLMLTLFVAFILLGIGPSASRVRTIGLLGLAVQLIVFGIGMITFADYARSGGGALLGPFPVSTTWLILGLWVAPTFFCVVYVIKFRDWILTPRHQETFRKLLAERDRSLSGKKS